MAPAKQSCTILFHFFVAHNLLLFVIDGFREAFQELMYYLDPTVEDLPVNMETLQSALRKWVVEVMTQNANSECQLDLSTLQFQFDQSKVYHFPL